MFWIGLIVGGCLGFVACALCAINRISSLEERAELEACKVEIAKVRAERNTLADTVRRLVGAAEKLRDKLTLIHNDDDYAAVWQIAQNHIGPYKGPQYDVEFAELKQALNELDAYTKATGQE